MPVILIYKGYKFFFFSNEGVPREPLHVHIRRGDARAKFSVAPDVQLVSSYGMKASELSELASVVEANRSLIQEKWREYFGE